MVLPGSRTCQSRLQNPIAPMGDSRCLLFAGRWCRCLRRWHSVNRELPDLLQHSCLCAHSSSKVPIAPMGILLTCLPRLTLAQLRTLRSTIQGVRDTETFQSSHRPDGKVADMLALTHTCTTANDASVKYSRCVPQLPSQFPIAPVGMPC